MIPHTELLIVFALIMLRAAQATAAPLTPLDSRANQGDSPTDKPLRFRCGIQATTARVAVITPIVVANATKTEIGVVVQDTIKSNATPRQEPYNMKEEQNRRDIEEEELKVDAQEDTQVQWEDGEGKGNGYLLGIYPSVIPRYPRMPTKEPPADERGVAESCNSEKLNKLPPGATVPWCPPGKLRMRAPGIVVKEPVEPRQEADKEGGAEQVLLATTVPRPSDAPAFSKTNPPAGEEEDPKLKRPPTRRQPDARDSYPSPDWFPLKPEKFKRPPVQAREVADIQNVEQSSSNSKQAPWLFDLGPAVSVPLPPAPLEKGAGNTSRQRSVPVLRIMRLQYRDVAANGRKLHEAWARRLPHL